jgi:hypothetical protein
MAVEISVTLENMDNSRLWGHHFRIPDEVVKKLTKGTDRRVLCSVNGTKAIHCAIMPSPEGAFIMLNKTLVKQLKLEVGKPASLLLEKDQSEFGMEVAEEFEAVIFGDEELAHYFSALTPGKKRNLLHLVNKLKSSDIRINRAMAIGQHLRETKGALDFKRLNETIKEFNQRNRMS